MYQQTNIPDIFVYNEYNPTLHSPNSPFDVSFAQTRESLIDVEIYRNFLDNAISRFRHSRTYKHYKAHLMLNMGLNKCQVMSNITSDEDAEMATIEMHHNILTIFDVALILTEHYLNQYGCITTFDLCELLRLEHINFRVCTVMLTKTAHQLVHTDPNFIIPPSMCFGNWMQFLDIYKDGITRDICYKLIYYIKKVIESEKALPEEIESLLQVKKCVENWSSYNELV